MMECVRGVRIASFAGRSIGSDADVESLDEKE